MKVSKSFLREIIQETLKLEMGTKKSSSVKIEYAIPTVDGLRFIIKVDNNVMHVLYPAGEGSPTYTADSRNPDFDVNDSSVQNAIKNAIRNHPKYQEYVNSKEKLILKRMGKY